MRIVLPLQTFTRIQVLILPRLHSLALHNPDNYLANLFIASPSAVAISPALNSWQFLLPCLNLVLKSSGFFYRFEYSENEIM